MRPSPRVSNNSYPKYQNFRPTYGFVHGRFFPREIVPSVIYVAAADLHAPANNG
jgi:hypothetical protein